jgi:ABC-type sugar transport system permease subunit
MRRKSILFVLPAFIIYTALMIVPIIGAFALSFTNWNGFVQSPIKFIGFRNFTMMMSDVRLGNAIGVTLHLTIVVVIAVNILGLALALLLNKAGKSSNFFRSIFFIPFILSTVAISFIWISILSYTGILNTVLGMIGLGALKGNYIGQTASSINSICVIEIWRMTGFHMMLYLAALQAVPQELYEASTIDGASRWQQLCYVTIPNIIPVITISVLMSIINEMRQYDVVKVITDGGPGYSTETITYNILTQAFGNSKMGYSSAIALFLFVVLGVISILQTILSNRLEERS